MDGKQIFWLTFLHFWSDVGNSRLFRTTSYEQSREYTEQELDHILTSCLTQYFINSEEFPFFVERTVIWRNISHITEQSRNYHATFSSSQIACKRTEYAAGPEEGFPCVVFPRREKPVFISWDPCNENRFFPVRKTTQVKPCFH